MLVYAHGIAIVAVVFTVVLMENNMLFAPFYQRLQAWTLRKYNKYPEQVYWLKPLISCALCVAGQWAFWGYLILALDVFHVNRYDYNVFHHIYFISLTILLTALIRKFYTWTQQP